MDDFLSEFHWTIEQFETEGFFKIMELCEYSNRKEKKERANTVIWSGRKYHKADPARARAMMGGD